MRLQGFTQQARGTDLAAEVTTQEEAAWETLDVNEWASDSYAVAREIAYRHSPQGNLIEDEDEISADYLDDNFDVVVTRLKMAGVRLAFLINSAVDGRCPRIFSIRGSDTVATINATAFSTMLQPQIKPFSVRFSTAC